MSVQCASCHINYRVTKDLLSSTCSTHHRKALIAKAESEFEEAKKEGMRLFTDSSFMNYLPAKKAWAKLRRLDGV